MIMATTPTTRAIEPRILKTRLRILSLGFTITFDNCFSILIIKTFKTKAIMHPIINGIKTDSNLLNKDNTI